EHFNHVIELDRARRTATVEAGIKYGQLGVFLHREGFALHNLASLPHISVAGACATATHGSGENNRNLATAVIAMELIKADGQVVALSRDQNGEEFNGMVVALGGLGIVTKLTLDIQPTFAMRQVVYENLPLTQLEKYFDAIQASAYSISLFTDWQKDHINQIWLKHRAIEGGSEVAAPTFFDATLAPVDRHPITEISAENCTPQMNLIGPWHERLPHFRMDYTPSSGAELQSEYFLPRHHAIAALRAVATLHDRIAPLLMISEIRTIAADNLWMSPCYQQNCLAIHFTWKQNWPAVSQLLPLIEEKLAPFDARPHWGKLFTMPAERLHSLYKKMPEFQQLLRSFDPLGKFRNHFLDRYIFAVT
ncbi:MAG TPA: D-arabinono-1,4-lactone oxidase, partial [Tepidisphaeraceae bacterium]|nr:D-arabinono-1,4-lactone oxidase [Tepidisphaeraceae bacterium]